MPPPTTCRFALIARAISNRSKGEVEGIAVVKSTHSAVVSLYARAYQGVVVDQTACIDIPTTSRRWFMPYGADVTAFVGMVSIAGDVPEVSYLNQR
jgi:hypothetical protein